MRCKNCGWPNKPNETVCVKCHTPLVAEDDDYVAPAGGYPSDGDGLNKTVMEEEVFGHGGMQGRPSPQPEHQPAAQEEEMTTCPKCGYPVRSGAEKCPNCNFQLKPVSEQPRYGGNDLRGERGHASSDRYPTRMSNEGDSQKFRGTINPYMMNLEMEPTFILKPVKRINERHDFDEQEYEGKEVILTRENTESNNASITSRQQAVVTRVDGHWFIEDRSEQKTTFVQAAHKVELHDGDIILLGNRLFEFHE